MAQPGTCPYCGNYNRLKYDQLYMHCVQCGKSLEIEPGGWLVPADVKALALYEESVAHLTDEEVASAANEHQKAKRKQRIKESALRPSAQLLQDYTLVEKSFKKIVQTGTVNLGLVMGTCGSILLIVVPPVLVGLALSNNLLTYPNSFIEVGLILFMNLTAWYIFIVLGKVALKNFRLLRAPNKMIISGEITGYDTVSEGYHAIYYEFKSPHSGEAIPARLRTFHSRRRRSKYPEVGSPVLVLYVNDNLHRVL